MIGSIVLTLGSLVASVLSPVIEVGRALVQTTPPDLGIVDFIRAIASGGAVTTFISFALEHIPPFQRLESEAKKWVVFILYMVLPVGATLILQYTPAAWWAFLDPLYSALAAGFSLWVGSQAVHQYGKFVARQRETRAAYLETGGRRQ